MPKPKSPKPPRTVEVCICNGVEGPCVIINGWRVAGNKPWGGGRIVMTREVPVAEIRRALSK
jgi:hypothetical protein